MRPVPATGVRGAYYPGLQVGVQELCWTTKELHPIYQTIDDPRDLSESAEATRKVQRRSSLRLVLIAMTIAAATLIGIIILSAPTRTPPALVVQSGERDAYLAALTERQPALRRARLSDFMRTYPESDRNAAVRAQLSVLDASEADAWAVVTNALYDDQLSNLDKVSAVDAYERVWRASVLGGRAEEIARIRETLAVEDVILPDRALDSSKSPIPESIQAGGLAGAPVASEPPIVFIPQPVEPVRTRSAEVTPPRILRAPKPRYPSKAQRRRVEAVVVISMVVDARGKVRDVEVVSNSAPRYARDFERAARRAARNTRFSPKLVDGRPEPAPSVIKRYRFRM